MPRGIKEQLKFVAASSAMDCLQGINAEDGHAFGFISRDTFLSYALSFYIIISKECKGFNPAHPSAARIFGGNAPDIRDLYSKKATVADIDEIVSECVKSPLQLTNKYYILNLSDKNEAAQNKLLKVLEEPPAYAKFILIADSSSGLLSTVRSRITVITPQLQENELLDIEDEYNPNLPYARYASRGNLTEFEDLLSGKNLQELNSAINISRMAGEERSLINALKYFPSGSSDVRGKLTKILGYLELIYGDLMRASVGINIDTFGVYDIKALIGKISPENLPNILTAIRRAVMRTYSGNISSIIDELLINLNYERRI